MSEHERKKILAHVAAENFVGRAAETEKVRRHAAGENDTHGMILAAAPGAGTSEILRQTYDYLFHEQKKIPFYFAFNKSDQNLKDCAIRFLQTFLLQTVAFRRGDAGLFDISPDVCEINELAHAADAHWIHQLTTECRKPSALNDIRSFVRQSLSAPLRAAANDAAPVVLLDDLQNAPPDLIEELKDIYAQANIRFVFAGRRRFVFRAFSVGEQKSNDVEILRFGDLPQTDAQFLTEKLAGKFDVSLNESTRDLIVRQLNSKPFFIETVLRAAREKKTNLDSFQAFERIYTDELFGGGIGKFYDDFFSSLEISSDARKKIIARLNAGLDDDSGCVSAKDWQTDLSADEETFAHLANRLHVEEIVNFNAGTICFSKENEVLKDYVEANNRFENLHEPRAQVVGETLRKSLERASELMERLYRQSSAAGLRELLAAFNCQSIPAALIDYEIFKKQHKQIDESATEENSSIALPQIFYTASGASFYAPIAQAAAENRVAVALGFARADYRRENEIVWLAAEIDSKLEASAELTEFWCDRLEAMALICNFATYQLWLVAPEGFAPEAVEVLKKRGAFGSSRVQIELLIGHLQTGKISAKKDLPFDYEMILPMDADAEMIAAGAVEEIARRHHFLSKDISKIKTAVVEAYINAAEHSHSPDRKIYQKIAVADDKIIITIANRGVKLSADAFAASAAAIEPENGRRGWGLKLMRTLMDEVKFELVDDGTQISMVKYIKSSANRE